MAEKTSKVTHQQTMGQKLRKETSASRSRKAKLRYDKKNNRENPSEVKKALAKKKQVIKKFLTHFKKNNLEQEML